MLAVRSNDTQGHAFGRGIDTNRSLHHNYLPSTRARLPSSSSSCAASAPPTQVTDRLEGRHTLSPSEPPTLVSEPLPTCSQHPDHASGGKDLTRHEHIPSTLSPDSLHKPTIKELQGERKQKVKETRRAMNFDAQNERWTQHPTSKQVEHQSQQAPYHVPFQTQPSGTSSLTQRPALVEDLTASQFEVVAPFLRVPALQQPYSYEVPSETAAPLPQDNEQMMPLEYLEYSSTLAPDPHAFEHGDDPANTQKLASTSLALSPSPSVQKSNDGSLVKDASDLCGMAGNAEHSVASSIVGSSSASSVSGQEGAPLKTKSHSRRKPEGHIKRPLNAFFLFRKHVSTNNLIPQSVAVRDQRAISRIIACMWSNLPADWQDEWRKEYDREREAFHSLHPEYKYKPDLKAAEKRAKRKLKSEQCSREQCVKIADAIFQSYSTPQAGPPTANKPAPSRKTVKTAKRGKSAVPRKVRSGAQPSRTKDVATRQGAAHGKMSSKPSRQRGMKGKSEAKDAKDPSQSGQQDSLGDGNVEDKAESPILRKVTLTRGKPQRKPPAKEKTSEASQPKLHSTSVNRDARRRSSSMPVTDDDHAGYTFPSIIAAGAIGDGGYSTFPLQAWNERLAEAAMSAAQSNLHASDGSSDLPPASFFTTLTPTSPMSVQQRSPLGVTPLQDVPLPSRRRKQPPPHLQLSPRAEQSPEEVSPRSYSSKVSDALPNHAFFAGNISEQRSGAIGQRSSNMDLDRQRPHTMATPRDAVFRIWPRSDLNATLLSPSSNNTADCRRSSKAGGGLPSAYGKTFKEAQQYRPNQAGDAPSEHPAATMGWTPLRSAFGLQPARLSGPSPSVHRMSFDERRRASLTMDSSLLDTSLGLSPRAIAREAQEPFTARHGGGFFVHGGGMSRRSVSSLPFPESDARATASEGADTNSFRAPSATSVSLHGPDFIPDLDFGLPTPRQFCCLGSGSFGSKTARQNMGGELASTPLQQDPYQHEQHHFQQVPLPLTYFGQHHHSGPSGLDELMVDRSVHSSVAASQSVDNDVFYFSPDFLETAQRDTSCA